MLFGTIQLYRFCSCAYFINIFLKTQIKRYAKVCILINFSLTLGQVRKHTFTYDEDSPVIIACK